LPICPRERANNYRGRIIYYQFTRKKYPKYDKYPKMK
jgi:hypothetical protein